MNQTCGWKGNLFHPTGLGKASSLQQNGSLLITNSNETQSQLSALLWSMELMRIALSSAPEAILNNNDIVLLLETFVMEEVTIVDFCSLQFQATQRERGRPSGRLTWQLKSAVKPINMIYKGTNVMTLGTSKADIVAACFNPDSQPEDIAGYWLQ